MDEEDIVFELKEQEFIPLNSLMKLLGLVNSGGEAKMMIKEGEVTVNGTIEYRLRNKIRKGMTVGFNGQLIIVK